MTYKTYKTYNVEAKGTIRICMDVHALSQEEAEALADQVKEIKYGDESILLDPWKPLYDAFDLEITSVEEENYET
tara:strand:- start:285 stop:509 length:225 start_codon:yes stop_codon:yes gene_type:complete